MRQENIIQRGDVAKYQIAITHEDFDQQHDDFYVVLHYGLSYNTIRIDKDQMFHDEEGNWFMFFQTSTLPLGRIKAETHYMVNDSDVCGGIREEVEWDWLGFVTEDPCPQFAYKCKCKMYIDDKQNDHVKFTRTFRSDANSLFLTLRTKDGEPVKDTEGQQLYVRKHNLI